jgi:hypothetical protein
LPIPATKRKIAMTVQDSKPSLSRRWENYQPTKSVLVWACVCTAAATMFVGFSWGGWVTGGTSRTIAAAAGKTAHGELASLICVDRFNAAADVAAKRVEFLALADSYKKRQFIEAGGWATMPGQKTPDTITAESCSVALTT